MPGYRHKDAVQLAFDANKKRLHAEGQIVLANVMNEALNEMTHEFNAALAEGTILHLEGTREEMARYLRRAVDNVIELESVDAALEAGA